MVGERLKSLIFEQFAARSDLRPFHIFYHPLPSATVCYKFCAVYSGHKITQPIFNSKAVSLCKLLRIKRKLVAGGRIELPTLGL